MQCQGRSGGQREGLEGLYREAEHLSATWPAVLSASGDVNRGT